MLPEFADLFQKEVQTLSVEQLGLLWHWITLEYMRRSHEQLSTRNDQRGLEAH